MKSQRKVFEVLGLIPESTKCCSGLGPSILKDHIVDSGITSRTPFFRRWDQFQILIGTSHFTWVWFGIHLFCLLWDWKVWSIYLLVCCPSWSVLMNIEEDSAKLFALNPPVRHFSAQTDVTDKHSLMTLEFMKVFNSDALITYRNYTWVAKIRRVSMEKRVCKDLK